MENKPKKLWFKRKRFGWGWTPVSWEGWLSVIIYTIVMVRTATKLDKTAHSVSDFLFNFACVFVLATIILIVLCYKKGEEPKWQWGKDTDEKPEN